MSYWDSSFSRYGERGRRPEVGSNWTYTLTDQVSGKPCSRQIVLTYVPESNGRLRFDYVKSRKGAPDWGTISLMSWCRRRVRGLIKPVRAKTSPKERGPRKPTKGQMIQFCRDAVWEKMGSGPWSFEFAAYRDEAHNQDAAVAGGYNDSIASDILEWSSLREYVAPGRVIDVFIYRRYGQYERQLWDHCLITLPTERAAYEAGGAA